MTVRNIASICNMVSILLLFTCVAIDFACSHSVWTWCVMMSVGESPPPLHPDTLCKGGRDGWSVNLTVVTSWRMCSLSRLGAQTGLHPQTLMA